MLSNFAKRMIHGIGANSFAQAVNLLIQLVSVPLYLHYWSLEEYGYWVLLSAAPAYFAMADAGVVSVAMNKMNMLTANGKEKEANQIFNSALLFVIVMIGTLGFGVALVIGLIDVSLIDVSNWKITLFLLILSALFAISGGLFDAVYRASNCYAIGVYALNLVRLTEWGGGLLFLVINKSFVSVATGICLGRIISSVFLYLYTKSCCPNFSWCIKSGRFSDIRKILAPAVSFMAFPIGNAISIQGMTLVVGTLLGPTVLAAFNVYRTISRTVIQLVAILSHTLWPEFSRLHGAKQYQLLKNIYQKGAMASAIVSIMSGIFLYFATPFVLNYWTHGKITHDSDFGLFFLIVTVTAGLWHVPRIILLATNMHAVVSIHYFMASMSMIWIAWIFGNALGTNGLFYSMVLFEIYMLAICIIENRRYFGVCNAK